MDSLTCLLLKNTFQSLARVLLKKQNLSLEDYNSFLSNCCIQNSKHEWTPKANFGYNEQYALLSMSWLVVEAKGKFQNEIVPVILQFMLNLSNYQWLISNSAQMNCLPAETFCKEFIEILLKIAHLKPAAFQKEILSSISYFLSDLIRRLKGTTEVDDLYFYVMPALNGTLLALESGRLNFQIDLSLKLIKPLLEIFSFDFNTKYSLLISQSEIKRKSPFQIEKKHILTQSNFSIRSMRVLMNLFGSLGLLDMTQLFESWEKSDCQLPLAATTWDQPIKEAAETIFSDVEKLFLSNSSKENSAFDQLICCQQFLFVLSRVCLKIPEPVVEKTLLLLSDASVKLPASFFVSSLNFITNLSAMFQTVEAKTFVFFELTQYENVEILKKFNANDLKMVQLTTMKSFAFILKLMKKDSLEEEIMRYINYFCSVNVEDQILHETFLIFIGIFSELVPRDMAENIVQPLFTQNLYQSLKDENWKECKRQVEILSLFSMEIGLKAFTERMDAFYLLKKSLLWVTEDGQEVQQLKSCLDQQFIKIGEQVVNFPELMEYHYKQILTLFIQQASIIHRQLFGKVVKEKEKGKSKEKLPQIITQENFLGEIVSLLRILNSIQINQIQLNREMTLDQIELLRGVWYISLLLGLKNENEWYESLQKEIEKLSKQMPILIFIDVEKQTNFESDYFTLSSDLQSEYERIVKYVKYAFTINDSELKGLDFDCLLFLLSVYWSEKNLSANPEFERILAYHQALKSTKLYPAFKKISNRLIREIILENQTKFNQKDIVYCQFQTLMKNYHQSDLFEFVLEAGLLFLEAFPYLLFEQKLFDLGSEILKVLLFALQSELTGEHVYSFQLKTIGKKIEISRQEGFRRVLLEEFKVFMRKWVQMAQLINPKEFSTIFQNSMNDFEETNLAGLLTDTKNLSVKSFYLGFLQGSKDLLKSNEKEIVAAAKQELIQMVHANSRKNQIEASQLEKVLMKTTAILLSQTKIDTELFHLFVWSPIQIFTAASLKAGVEAWSWFLGSQRKYEERFLSEMTDVWDWAIRRNRGIFSQKYNIQNVFTKKMNSGPSKKSKDMEVSSAYFLPHLIWIDFLVSHYEIFRLNSGNHYMHFRRLMLNTLYRRNQQNSNHPLARICYFKLWLLSWKLLASPFSKQHDQSMELNLKLKLYETLINLMAMPCSAIGLDMKYVQMEILLLKQLYDAIQIDFQLPITIINVKAKALKEMQQMVQVSLEFELHRLLIWYNPLHQPEKKLFPTEEIFRNRKHLSGKQALKIITKFWLISPRLALQYANRLQLKNVDDWILKQCAQEAFQCCVLSEAIPYLTRIQNPEVLKYLVFSPAVPPITAISYFLPNPNQSYLIQYGLRSLDSYPVEAVFFYVPQLVQALRHDTLGYVEQFILKTAQRSQLFAHQIIWNMQANFYRLFKSEEESSVDVLKPTLERIIQRIVNSLSGQAQIFYEREFKFFDQVTGISGKLKPFIRRTKNEKKQKIDEELKQVHVDPGVYLPSNPESIVIDIDYDSGRPLQSHAKAPFMATFKIKKAQQQAEVNKRQSSYESLNLQDDQNDEMSSTQSEEEDQWQSAIFKVGDDCRQDVLALQLISIMKNIFESAGLNLYLFPYRTVATNPGCGVIEVVPNSVSRDQMGRQNMNDLYQWFLLKYGKENTLRYQKAQDAFMSSLAAYSLVLYLLQIKDRHNGNVLIDDDGHLIHIDFGFIFDIVPGGVKFELAPFKLTKEMVQILGGSPTAPAFQKFVEQIVRAFLCIRPYAEQILQVVELMLDSGLPCFIGEMSLHGLRERFQLQLTDQEAAVYMQKLVQISYRAFSTFVYDGYQKLTNGIPF